MFDFLAPDGGLRRFENLRINYSLKRTQNLRLKCLKLLKMFMVEKKTNRSTQDRKINRTNVTNSLCVASFTPEMTFISTMVSFVIPGIAIVIANIGLSQSFIMSHIV